MLWSSNDGTVRSHDAETERSHGAADDSPQQGDVVGREYEASTKSHIVATKKLSGIVIMISHVGCIRFARARVHSLLYVL